MSGPSEEPYDESLHERPEESAAEIDCRGLPCPTPVIRLARALPEVRVGGVVAVAADDAAAATDIQAWCRMRGQEYVGERLAADGVAVHLVRRRV
jgi:tRNA 2-thiouridine synthesizing protein A